jgi:hypothetical protein
VTDLDDGFPRDVVDDLRAGFLEAPSDRVADAHLAAMAAAAEHVSNLSSIGRRRRRVVIASSAAALGVSVLLTGGLAAAAGNLPAPLQAVVARVIEPFGVDLPDGSSTTDTVEPGDTPAPPPSAETTLLPGSEPNATELPASGAVDPGTATAPTTEPSAAGSQTGSGEDRGSSPGESTPQSNKPEVPPGQTEDHESKPDAPPGQTEDHSKNPDTPPGQNR